MERKKLTAKDISRLKTDPGFREEIRARFEERQEQEEQENKKKAPPDLKLDPRIKFPYTMYKMMREWAEACKEAAEREDTPEWLKEAVVKTIDLALRENAAIMPGDQADLGHGHLLIPTGLKDVSRQKALEGVQAVLFHSQEILDSEYYGLDRSKRNILFERASGEVRILDVTMFETTEYLGIGSYAQNLGLIEAGRVAFWLDARGEVKVSAGVGSDQVML